MAETLMPMAWAKPKTMAASMEPSGSPAPTGSNPFTDVSEEDYYYQAALWAYENGLVEGDTFGGSTPCTRAATVTYLWKLAGEPETALRRSGLITSLRAV